MPRPHCQRLIGGSPRAQVFKPRGVPMADMAEVHLATDGWESIRLCDHEGLDHELAAKRMGVSRPTLGRILARAHAAVAQALVEGCALVIDLPGDAVQGCADCSGHWPGPRSLTRCPQCGSCRLHLVLNHPAARRGNVPASSRSPGDHR